MVSLGWKDLLFGSGVLPVPSDHSETCKRVSFVRVFPCTEPEREQQTLPMAYPALTGRHLHVTEHGLVRAPLELLARLRRPAAGHQ